MFRGQHVREREGQFALLLRWTACTWQHILCTIACCMFDYHHHVRLCKAGLI